MISFLRMQQTTLLAAISVSVTIALSSTADAQGPRGRGRGNPNIAVDRDVFHFLLENHELIHRTVDQLPDGVRTSTTSEDPEVAKKIKEHVQAMYRRVEDRRPLRRWDPLFAAIFDHAEKVEMQLKEVDGGVEVIERSTDHKVVALIQAHAKVVSAFVEKGFAEAHKSHPVESPMQQAPRTVEPSDANTLLELSRELDSYYIPALALTQQQRKDASLRALKRFSDRLPKLEKEAVALVADNGKSLFSGFLKVAEEATAQAQADRLQEAHETLEPIRDQLTQRRRSLGLRYPLDVLTDFHGVMEEIVKPALAATPEQVDDQYLNRLSQQAAKASALWAKIEQTSFSTPSATSTKVESSVRDAAVAAERQALTELNLALRANNAAEILRAAAALKPPFARLYISFGDFQGLEE